MGKRGLEAFTFQTNAPDNLQYRVLDFAEAVRPSRLPVC